MLHLLLMLSWLHYTIPGTIPVPDIPPAPVRLRLSSVDFNHTLKWDRGAGTSTEVPYSVSFHTDSGAYEVVAGCERVLEPLLCDLTDACSAPEEIYHLRVTALHPSEPSYSSYSSYSSGKDSGFYPVRDTELQPPVLQVALCNSSLCVDVEAPVPRLSDIYRTFWYELKVESSTAQQPTLILFHSLRRHLIPVVSVGSQVCVSVRFADSIVPRESSFSAARCVSVPGPSHTVLPSVLPSVLPPVVLAGLLLLLLVVLYSVSMFLKRPALPSVLTSVLHSDQKLEVSCHPAVSSLLLIDTAPPEGQTEHCSSETDSEDERDTTETTDSTGISSAAQYTSKASLCSMRASAACREVEVQVEGSKEVEVQVEGSEEVDLLTLTFSRDKDTETSAPLLPELEHPVCNEEEEEAGPEEESSEDCSQSGYMLR